MSRIIARFAYNMSRYEGVPVPLDIFDRSSKRVFAESIALRSDGTKIDQDFASGTYLMRAMLPSGEVLAQTIAIRSGEDATAVFRPKHQSPREELSWAYYLQKAPSSLLDIPESVRLAERLKTGLPRSLPLNITFWTRSLSGWKTVSHDNPRFFRHVQFDSSPDLKFEGIRMRVVVEFPNNDWRLFPSQVWLQASDSLGSQFVALPVLRRLEVLISDAHRSTYQTPFHIQTSNGDARVESILSFLGSGDFDSARLIGSNWAEKAEELLQDKVSDPIAATLAGYLLLRAGELGRLHDWTANLANWFEWLPDGAVIRAWHLMCAVRPEIEKIRDMLVTAVDRGIPYYSMGLRMLHNGLKLLDQRDLADEEISKALHKIAPYVEAMDLSALVTSFVANEPSQPGVDYRSPITRRVPRPESGEYQDILVRPPREYSWGDTYLGATRQTITGAVPRPVQRPWAHAHQRRYWGMVARNRSELADRIASEAKISKAKADDVVDTALTTIISALSKGDRVALTGFGTFSVSQRKARNGRNPQTGATIKIAARRVAKFTPGHELKKAVNRKR